MTDRPLTTGEGNTAEQAERLAGLMSVRPLRQREAEDAVNTILAVAAECGRLREQLDAARQAAQDVMASLDLIGEGDWTPQDVLAHRLARAALTETEQREPLEQAAQS